MAEQSKSNTKTRKIVAGILLAILLALLGINDTGGILTDVQRAIGITDSVIVKQFEIRTQPVDQATISRLEFEIGSRYADTLETVKNKLRYAQRQLRKDRAAGGNPDSLAIYYLEQDYQSLYALHMDSREELGRALDIIAAQGYLFIDTIFTFDRDREIRVDGDLVKSDTVTDSLHLRLVLENGKLNLSMLPYGQILTFDLENQQGIYDAILNMEWWQWLIVVSGIVVSQL